LLVSQTSFNAVKSVKITNVTTKTSMVQASFGLNGKNGNVGTWPTADTDKSNGGRWWLYPVNGRNKYIIVNMNSGSVLVQDGFGTSSNVSTWPFQQIAKGETGYIWELKYVSGGTRIINVKTGHGMVQASFESNKELQSGNVNVWPLASTSGKGGLWKIDDGKSIGTPAVRSMKKQEPFPPEMTSHAKPLNKTAGIIERNWIPFFFIKDSKLSSSQQTSKSPWYYLERSVTYVVENNNYKYNEHNTTPIKHSITHASSWTKSVQQSFEYTIGVSATAGGDSWGGSATASFSMTSSFSSSLSKTSEVAETYEYSLIANTSYAVYTTLQTFTLKRMDGTEVKSWTIATNNTGVSFPSH
jgi:hypothetical protein